MSHSRKKEAREAHKLSDYAQHAKGLKCVMQILNEQGGEREKEVQSRIRGGGEGKGGGGGRQYRVMKANFAPL